MDNRKSIIFILSLFLIASGFINSSIREIESVELEKLELRINKDSIGGINISIFNHSKDSIKIVLPGDGSIIGWRTPIVRWSVIKKGGDEKHPNKLPELDKKFGRCKMMNPPKREEIISIGSHSQVEIKGGVYWPQIPKKNGKYSVKLYLLNDPNNRLGKIRDTTSELSEIIKNKTEEFLLISNELIFEIVE